MPAFDVYSAPPTSDSFTLDEWVACTFSWVAGRTCPVAELAEYVAIGAYDGWKVELIPFIAFFIWGDSPTTPPYSVWRVLAASENPADDLLSLKDYFSMLGLRTAVRLARRGGRQ